MCLVLGCPGAGCTTFLKTIANHREGYAKVTGNVLYAGIDATEIEKYYKGEVVYNQEGEKVLTFHVLHTLTCGILRRHSHRNAYRCSDPRIRSINVSVFEWILRAGIDRVVAFQKNTRSRRPFTRAHEEGI